MQALNMEQDAQGNACFNPLQSCSQGNIPSYAVVVSKPDDVSKAVKFGAQHNLQVVIKCSGHEYQGRSTAPNALLVWTHKFTGVKINENYKACRNSQPVPAVKVLSGTPWGVVYETVAQTNQYAVVGGVSQTVCASGGYILGGGHSFMSPSHGLGVDNVLSFDVVLADGSIVKTSPCSYPDLFWALRGGGGGTFAIVTSTTYKLHPIPAGGVSGLSIRLDLLNGAQSVALLWDAILSVAPSLVDYQLLGGVWGGSFTLSSTSFSLDFVFNDTNSVASPSAGFLYEFVASQPEDFTITFAELFPVASMNDWHSAVYHGDVTGIPVALGSRLIPNSFCTDPDNRAAATSALTMITMYSAVGTIGTLIGGAVSNYDLESTQTSVTPAWRSTCLHVFTGTAWAPETPWDEVLQQYQYVSALTQLLRDAIPVSGAYFSESDYLEPNWQQTFWGTNYPRLKALKKKYDPKGLFSCHHCVEIGK